MVEDAVADADGVTVTAHAASDKNVTGIVASTLAGCALLPFGFKADDGVDDVDALLGFEAAAAFEVCGTNADECSE